MRSLLLAIVVAASGCHGAKQTGPAWPAPSTTADDGGQSIEPRPTSVATSVEKSADNDDEDDKKADAPAAKSAATDEKPASTPTLPSAQPTEPVMLDDEIIIEVDD